MYAEESVKLLQVGSKADIGHYTLADGQTNYHDNWSFDLRI